MDGYDHIICGDEWVRCQYGNHEIAISIGKNGQHSSHPCPRVGPRWQMPWLRLCELWHRPGSHQGAKPWGKFSPTVNRCWHESGGCCFFMQNSIIFPTFNIIPWSFAMETCSWVEQAVSQMHLHAGLLSDIQQEGWSETCRFSLVVQLKSRCFYVSAACVFVGGVPAWKKAYYTLSALLLDYKRQGDTCGFGREQAGPIWSWKGSSRETTRLKAFAFSRWHVHIGSFVSFATMYPSCCWKVKN